MNVRAIAIATALAIAAASVITAVISFQPNPRAQAHDDGTSHIHVTPTPTPTPTPAPLGLNGPLSLGTSVVYQDADRELVVISTINNPPPDGWEFDQATMKISASHEDWILETSARGYSSRYIVDGQQRVVFNTDHLIAELPLPDYADFGGLTEPVLANVWVYMVYRDDARGDEIQLRETVYIDLNDRNNWR